MSSDKNKLFMSRWSLSKVTLGRYFTTKRRLNLLDHGELMMVVKKYEFKELLSFFQSMESAPNRNVRAKIQRVLISLRATELTY